MIPKTHTLIGEASAMSPHGWLPGHDYRRVCAALSRGRKYRVFIRETWGRPEQHGGRDVTTYGHSAAAAISAAREAAIAAQISRPLLEQVLGRLLDAAADADA